MTRRHLATFLTVTGLLVGMSVLVGGSAAAAPTATSARVLCDDPVADSTLSALKAALIEDYPERLAKSKVVGPLRRSPIFVCYLGTSGFAKATFVIPHHKKRTRVRFQRRRGKGRWHARVGSGSFKPIPCAVRKAFKEVKHC